MEAATAFRLRSEERQPAPSEAVRWASETLVWAPDLGMGYYPVSEQPYDAAYFAKYQGYAQTEQGRRIIEARTALVRRYAIGASACDVGIGCGAFIEAAGGYGFDINPVAVAWLRERGLFLDPRQVPVDALTFWDSLEHLSDPAAFVAAAREWVFCSLPIVPGDGPPPKGWKHRRDDEHCFYWTRSGLIRWMDREGFECMEVNAMETLLGREDIESLVFRRLR